MARRRKIKMNKETDREFSEGFIRDLGSILQLCADGNTDSITLQFEINGKQLHVDMTFYVEEG